MLSRHLVRQLLQSGVDRLRGEDEPDAENDSNPLAIAKTDGDSNDERYKRTHKLDTRVHAGREQSFHSAGCVDEGLKPFLHDLAE